jgi:hypothetical protein
MAAAVISLDHNGFGAIDDCGLVVGDGAHLLVGLHVDGLGLLVDGDMAVDRGGGDVGGRAGLFAEEEAGTVAEGEAPGLGVGGGDEGEGRCGGEGSGQEFFHCGVCG